MASSEKQKALAALALVLETSTAALAFLASPVKDQDASLDGSNLIVLHKDFLSILSLIHASSTKTSLVLKPSSPSYRAALEPLTELKDRVAALPHCVRLLQTTHGKTLSAEATNIARDVLEGIQALMKTLINIGSESASPNGEAGDIYMVRTGTVHDIIDKARGLDGFSRNNLIAVQKILRDTQESLDDGVNEVRETLENAENTVDGQGNLDDGWDEFGISSNVKPSATEMERIKKIYTILRLSTLFHQRIHRDVLSQLSFSAPPSKETNLILDDIAQASSDLVMFADNFVITMYPPQVEQDISTELRGFQRQISIIQSKIDPLIPEISLEGQLQELQLTNAKKSTDYAKLRKWYTACMSQINKSINELEHELKGQETPLD